MMKHYENCNPYSLEKWDDDVAHIMYFIADIYSDNQRDQNHMNIEPHPDDDYEECEAFICKQCINKYKTVANIKYCNASIETKAKCDNYYREFLHPHDPRHMYLDDLSKYSPFSQFSAKS
jgi:hypothetical protein